MNKYHNKKNIYIDHVAIRVMNLEKSINFYKNVLGLEVIEEKIGTVVLGFGEKVLLKLSEATTPKQIKAAGLYHIAYLVPNRSDLANWLYYHIQNKTKLDGASNHGVSEAIYLRDIDGNGIEVYTDTPNDTWEWNNQQINMGTEALDIDDLLSIATTPTNSLPKNTIIGHLHLSVLNLDITQEFYHLLGFETVLYMHSAAFLSSQKYHHHLGMNVWGMNNAKSHIKTQVDMDYFVIHYPSKNDVDLVLKKLKQKGIEYIKHQDYISVTDNNGIESHLMF